MNWYIKVLKQYADFSGRARRREYWTFALINSVVLCALILLDVFVGTYMSWFHFGGGLIAFVSRLGIFSGLYLLAVLLPGLGVSVRRLHDAGQSGWWLLIGLVPYAGVIVVLVLAALDGTRGANRYGADPKAVTGASY